MVHLFVIYGLCTLNISSKFLLITWKWLSSMKMSRSNFFAGNKICIRNSENLQTFLDFNDPFKDLNFKLIFARRYTSNFPVIENFKSESSISITAVASLKTWSKFLALEVCIICYAKKTCICTGGQMRVQLLLSKQSLILSWLPDP